MYDYEIEKPFPIDIGANIEFIGYRKDNKMYRAKTLPGLKRSVSWKITSWCGIGIGAVHWYGGLRVYSLSIEVIEVYGDEKKFHKPGDRFSTNFFNETTEKYPDLKWAEGFDIDITYLRETDEENPYERNPLLLEKKGDHSTRFSDFYLLKERLEEEFERLFKSPWKIHHGCSTEEGLQHLRKLKRSDV